MQTQPNSTPSVREAAAMASEMVGPRYSPPELARPTRLTHEWPCVSRALPSQAWNSGSATHLYTTQSRPDDLARREAWPELSMTRRNGKGRSMPVRPGSSWMS